MYADINPATGFPVKPAKRTLYCATILNNCCSWSTLEAFSEDELNAKIEAGQVAGWYGGTIREVYTREAYDPGELAAYRAEVARIERTTCILPPDEDLRLLAWAKTLAPEQADEIDPEAGRFQMTRNRLKDRRNELRNQWLRQVNAGRI